MTLTPEQQKGIEEAVITANLASRHPVDFRRSFPFLHRRYFVVFLLGKDVRKRARETSTIGRIFSTVGIMLGVLFCILSVLLALYMIKSALGIDVFNHFHVGIWGWYIEHRSKVNPSWF